MQRYTVYYYESNQDVNSWKSEPKAAFIKAKDSFHAEKEFKSRFSGTTLLRIVPKIKKIRRLEHDQP